MLGCFEALNDTFQYTFIQRICSCSRRRCSPSKMLNDLDDDDDLSTDGESLYESPTVYKS